MGYWKTEESITEAKVTEPILESQKTSDGLLEDKLFSFDASEIQKGYLNDKYKIRILTPIKVIIYLKNLRKKYQNIQIYYLVEPYHRLVRAAVSCGPTLEQIFNKKLFLNKHIKSAFEVYDDETGNKLGRFEFTIDYREDKFFFNMELLRYPIKTVIPVRYLHVILSKDLNILHIDGEIHSYSEDELIKRDRYPFSFNKNVKSMKCFRVDGDLSIEELPLLAHIWLEFYSKDIKLREITAYEHMLKSFLSLLPSTQ